MATCRQVNQLMSEGLDRRLSFAQRFAIRAHLLICRFCRRYRRQLIFIRTAVRRLSQHAEDLSDHGLPDEARRRIQTHLNTRVK